MQNDIAESIPRAQSRPFSLADWRYDAHGSRRDLRLDLLRGLFLVFMLIYHYHQSWLTHYTYESLGNVSAAEGFVFISGMVVALVYFPIVERQGIGAALRKAWKRAFHLYLADVVTLGAIFLLGSFLLPLKAVTRILSDTPPLQVALDIVTLRLGTLGFDILLLYILLLFFTPLFLWLIQTRRTLWLIAGSLALYLLYHRSPETFMWQFSNKDSWRFPFMVWQVLFVGGMVTVAHRARLGELWQRVAPLRPGYWIALLFIVLFVFRQLLNNNVVNLAPATYDFWFDKTMLGVGRLFNFAVVALVLYWVTTHLWKPLARGPGVILIPLGQASLYVFLVHLLLAYIYRSFSPELPLAGSGLYEAASVLFIWFLVRRKFLFRLVPH
jgi:hypothetical protein